MVAIMDAQLLAGITDEPSEYQPFVNLVKTFYCEDVVKASLLSVVTGHKYGHFAIMPINYTADEFGTFVAEYNLSRENRTNHIFPLRVSHRALYLYKRHYGLRSKNPAAEVSKGVVYLHTANPLQLTRTECLDEIARFPTQTDYTDGNSLRNVMKLLVVSFHLQVDLAKEDERLRHIVS